MVSAAWERAYPLPAREPIRAVPQPPKDDGERKQWRQARRRELTIGDDFRPYELFDEFELIPVQLMSVKSLGPGAKLVWGLIAKHIGRDRLAFPGEALMAEELGTNPRQIRRYLEELTGAKLVRIIRGARNETQEYRLLWHEIFCQDNLSSQKEVGTRAEHLLSKRSNKTRPDKSSSSNRTNCPDIEDELSDRREDKLSSKKNHHHQKRENIKEYPEKNRRISDRSSLPSSPKPAENADRPLVASNGPNFFSDDDDEKLSRRERLADPIEEFRERLQERTWKNGPIDPEGIVKTVREALKNSPSTIKRFLEYESALTAPEKLDNPGGHYRKLLQEFLKSEPNSRIEEQRKNGASQQSAHDAWCCRHGKGCKMGVIDDENGLPVEVCSCADDFPKDRLEKLRSDVRNLRVMNGLSSKQLARGAA